MNQRKNPTTLQIHMPNSFTPRYIFESASQFLIASLYSFETMDTRTVCNILVL